MLYADVIMHVYMFRQRCINLNMCSKGIMCDEEFYLFDGGTVVARTYIRSAEAWTDSDVAHMSERNSSHAYVVTDLLSFCLGFHKCQPT